MTAVVAPAVFRIARAVAREAMGDGARAVVLTGSHARGAANAHSDIDLIIIVAKPPAGRETPWPPRRRGGHLVTTLWETEAGTRGCFREPRLFTTFVPGWREAIILEDPTGVAAKLQAMANRWTWDSVSEIADRSVAEYITGYAEEVHKLVAALERGNTRNAAAQRSILAVHLAGGMAVRHHILFGTDNVLWDLVAEAMGEPWASAQAAALSLGGEGLEASCRAALRLYALAAHEVWRLLDRRQRAVVGHACAIAGWPFQGAGDR